MYLQKVGNKQKKLCKKFLFCCHLGGQWRNSRIRIQDPDPNPDPNPDPDPLVRIMDPIIRIRIHPKMSWVRNTDLYGTGWYRMIPRTVLSCLFWKTVTSVVFSSLFLLTSGRSNSRGNNWFYDFPIHVLNHFFPFVFLFPFVLPFHLWLSVPFVFPFNFCFRSIRVSVPACVSSICVSVPVCVPVPFVFFCHRRKLLLGGAAVGGLLLAGRVLERKFIKVSSNLP